MLKIIGTPIGNIEDVSLRQLKEFFSIPIVFAEDTRNFLKLKSILKERYLDILKIFEIDLELKQQIFSYREQNHNNATVQILSFLREGNDVALVSDAGMPTISDPGQRLVEEILKNNYEVDVIPSATAIETALAISGIETDKFTFLGFLPRERGKIQKLISQNSHNTIVIYESPFRVIKTLEYAAELNERFYIAACNDLTKKFQKIFRGNISEVIERLRTEKKIVGEWVIILKI